jgi:hypothetical protein
MPDKRAYAQALLEIARRFNRMDRDLVRGLLRMLRETRAEIAAQMAMGGTAFDLYRQRQLMQSIERTVNELEGRLVGLTAETVTQANELGALSVTEPLRAIGLQTAYYRPSTRQAAMLVDYSSDLIRNVSSEVIGKINTQIKLAALGTVDSGLVMKRITQILGVDDGGRYIVGGIALRSERILRTETMRVYNLAAASQGKATAEQLPGTLKRWMATGDSRTRASHLAAHQRYYNDPIPVAEPFIVGGEELDYPLDPSGSPENTINCRCRYILVHPEIGVIGTPQDSAVTRETNRRAGSEDSE